MQQPLPVPADHVLQQNAISDPYGTPLPVPQKPFFIQRPDLQWVLATTAAVLVHSLQDNCQSGPVSTFAFNLFSQNRFNNTYFMTIVDEGSDFAIQQLGVMHQGEQPQAVVTRAVQFYAAYVAAACARNFPPLQQYLTPDMAQRINQIIQQWNALSANLAAPQAQVQQPGGIGMVAAQQGRGLYGGGVDLGQLCAGTQVGVSTTSIGSYAYNPGAVDENSKFGPATKPRLVPDARRKPEPEPALAELGVIETTSTATTIQPRVEITRAPDTRLVPDRVVVARTPSDSPIPESRPAGVTIADDIPEVSVFNEEELSEEWASRVTFANEPRPEYVLDEKVVGRFLFRPLNTSVGVPNTYEEAELEEEEDLQILDIVGMPNGPDDWSVLELRDGAVAALATADDAGRTWSIDNPHNHPYDPLTHFRYLVGSNADGYVVVDGQARPEQIFEAFLPRDPDVEYTDLEFDDSKRARARQEQLSKRNILADLSVISEITPRGMPYTIIGAVEELTTLEHAGDQDKLLEGLEKFQGKLSFFESPEVSMEVPAAQAMVERFFERVTALNAVPATAGFYEREFVVPGFATKISDFNQLEFGKRLAKLLLLINDLQETAPRAFRYFNELCTKEVNRVLGCALGMEALVIADFTEDYFELCNVVEAKYSETAFQRLQEAVAKALGSINLTYSGSILKVRHTYRVIGLPVGMASFKLPTAAGESYKVLASTSPELFILIRQLEKDDTVVKRGKTYLFGTDGELFEVIDSIWDEGYVTFIRA